MKKILLIGDFNTWLYKVGRSLNTEYNVRNIHFVDDNIDAKKIIESLNVSRYVKSDNFHEVTIEIIDFEPDVIIYKSEYLFQREIIDEDQLQISLYDMYNHLRETISSQNIHLVIIGEEIHNLNDIIQKNHNLAIESIVGMKKLSLLNLPHNIFEITTEDIDLSRIYDEIFNTLLDIVNNKKYKI